MHPNRLELFLNSKGEHLNFAESRNKRFYHFIAEHTISDMLLSQKLQAAPIDFPELATDTKC